MGLIANAAPWDLLLPDPPRNPEPAREAMARRASSFTTAGGLLPAEVREDVALVYSVFRTLDDLVDTGDPRAESRLAATERWARSALSESTPETQILAAVAGRHELPRTAITDFCAGMRQDLAGVHLATERELDRYCYRVAGTVGLVMASLLGVDGGQAPRACAIALGIAMQRTNILRDIDEDAAAGRVYISDEARRRHGWSLAPGERAPLVAAQIARADELFEDGLLGIRSLHRGRAAIALATGLYREILREIERTGLGQDGGRAVVSAQRKVLTALRVTMSGR